MIGADRRRSSAVHSNNKKSLARRVSGIKGQSIIYQLSRIYVYRTFQTVCGATSEAARSRGVESVASGRRGRGRLLDY